MILNLYVSCLDSTDKNPFMNYMYLGKEFKKPCDVSDEEINKILNAANSTASKVLYSTCKIRIKWFKFSNYLHGNTSICRDSGYLCKANSEQFKNTDRIITSYKNTNLYKKYK